MAISWTELTITPRCVAEYRADVSATIVDDDPATGYTETFREKNAVIETGPQKAAVLDRLWNQYQHYLIRRASITTWLSTMEADGLANLNGRL